MQQIRSGWDSNQRPRAPKANTITTENSPQRKCHVLYLYWEAAMLDGVVSRDNISSLGLIGTCITFFPFYGLG